MFYIAICDDEDYFCRKEKKIIEKYMMQRECKVKIELFSSGEELLQNKNSVLKYGIIFLDISMEKLNGMETAKYIRTITREAYIVFVTAYINYALEGYRVDAIRYLLKDNENFEDSLVECLDTIFYKMRYRIDKKWFDFQEGRKNLKLANLIYIESNLHKLTFHVINEKRKEYSMYAKLDEMDEILEELGFCRIHKSYLINLKYVDSMMRYLVCLSNGMELSISRKKYKDAEEKWICYKGEI